MERAREEMNLIARGLAKQYPDTNSKFTAVGLTSELDHLVGKTRPRMVILLISVGVVLLIACMNVANLLLVRASRRNREIALRAALGAKRIRVVRQMLTESVVLGAGRRHHWDSHRDVGAQTVYCVERAKSSAHPECRAGRTMCFSLPLVLHC